jgi:hypothetical protein
VAWFAFIQELEIFSVVLKHVTDAELDICLCTFHRIVNVSKGQFGLDHPELSDVSAGVRNLSSEGRAEGIDVGECACEIFDSQLA